MRILMAGAAALALAASGAYAQPGNGKGNGNNGGGKPDTAQQQKANGGNKADRGPQREAKTDNRGNSNAKAERGPQRTAQADNRGNGNAKADRGSTKQNVDRGNDNRDARGKNNNAIRQVNDRDTRTVRVNYDRDGSRYRDRDGDWSRDWLRLDHSRGLVTGCPPGLAKKRNGCNPPGQVKDNYDYRRSIFGSYYRPSLFGLLGYDRGDYYYRDGYLVRYRDNSMSGWIPLLGGALGIGNVWPTGYTSYDLPDYYVDYYDLGGRDRYRYADNVIYRVNPEDAAITSIAALITGDEFEVGRPMPMGYDVYNVPYAYRDRYYDTPQAMYRYSDGYVYRVDPETQLVAAVIDLLV